MKKASTSITIDASPERVWSILTDFASYPEWNPFIKAISGSLRVRCKLGVRIHPPGGKAMSFKPTVCVVNPNREFRWLGRLVMPGLFDGEHHFRLSPTGRATLLEHGEDFSGLIVRLMGPGMFEQSERGFAAMNEALKKRAEA